MPPWPGIRVAVVITFDVRFLVTFGGIFSTWPGLAKHVLGVAQPLNWQVEIGGSVAAR
jgi:hypothetical protein